MQRRTICAAAAVEAVEPYLAARLAQELSVKSLL